LYVNFVRYLYRTIVLIAGQTINLKRGKYMNFNSNNRLRTRIGNLEMKNPVMEMSFVLCQSGTAGHRNNRVDK
jgi:hypothetical protein